MCLELPLQAKDALPEMPVRLLDPKAGTWSVVECSAEEGEELPKPRGGHSVSGCCCALAAAAVAIMLLPYSQRGGVQRGGGEELPKPRGGHSVGAAVALRLRLTVVKQGAARCAQTSSASCVLKTFLALSASLQGLLVGSRLFVFGGEDVMRRPLGELLVLDLATWRWSRPETSGALWIRIEHCAAGCVGQRPACRVCSNRAQQHGLQVTIGWNKPAVHVAAAAAVLPLCCEQSGACRMHAWHMNRAASLLALTQAPRRARALRTLRLCTPTATCSSLAAAQVWILFAHVAHHSTPCRTLLYYHCWRALLAECAISPALSQTCFCWLADSISAPGLTPCCPACFAAHTVAHCNNELWMLDTETMEWSQPEAEGPVPPPRAGAAG